jgi:hypothetical protein
LPPLGDLIADIERDALHREILRTQGAVSTHYDRDALGRRTAARTGSPYALPASYAPGEHRIAKFGEAERNSDVS